MSKDQGSGSLFTLEMWELRNSYKNPEHRGGYKLISSSLPLAWGSVLQSRDDHTPPPRKPQYNVVVEG